MKKNQRLNWRRVFWTFIVCIVSIIAVDCVRRQFYDTTTGSIIVNGNFKSLDISGSNITILSTDSEPDAEGSVEHLGYSQINISRESMYTGSLCLINAGNPANGIFLSMTGLAETKNDFYILRDENMVLSIEAAGQLNKMMSDYNAATENDNFVVYSTTQSYSGADSIYTVSYPESITGYTVDLAIKSSSGDIIEYDGMDTESWIIDNCTKYGFIVRYPQDKESITGVSASVAHLRYVGDVHAAIMKEKNYCLEEYIDFLKNYTLDTGAFEYTLNEKTYEIYYASADMNGAETTKTTISVPVDFNYTISGNNIDGFIITVIK